MKYLQRLFASSNNNQQETTSPSEASSATSSALKLYSVTFVAKPISASASALSPEANFQIGSDNKLERAPDASRPLATTNSSSQRNSIDLTQVSVSFRGGGLDEETSAIIVNLNNRTTTTHSNQSHFQSNTTTGSPERCAANFQPELESNVSCVEVEEEDDWILIDNLSPSLPAEKPAKSGRKKLERSKMALDKKDIQLIEASWAPARKDAASAGILLFKGLFTKFPQYLRFFPAFADLDLENMKDNKRLLRHAVKVIETVGFVVEAVGDEKMAGQLQSALLNLVSSHLKRNIGSNEFRNLGIVLIDFICEINHQRSESPEAASKHISNNQRQIDQSSTGGSINQSSNDDSETMTSALEKLGGSLSTTSSSISSNELGGDKIGELISSENHVDHGKEQQDEQEEEGQEEESEVDSGAMKLDTGNLVAAWTKLYGGILNLVEQEEAKLK